MSWRFLPISRLAQVASAWQRLHQKFDEAPLLDPLFITPLIEEFATGRELVVHFEAPSSPGAIGYNAFSRTIVGGTRCKYFDLSYKG
jgi:hypothetical protein